MSIITPYILIEEKGVEPEQVFATLLMLDIYRNYGSFIFQTGLKTFTTGGVVLKRIKELLMTEDLENLEKGFFRTNNIKALEDP